MQEQNQRLSKIAREFNVGVDTILEFLLAQGVEDLNRNSKLIEANSWQSFLQRETFGKRK